MTTYLSAVPAYGRDYKTKKEVEQAWNEGKDFLVQDVFSGGYINKDDIDSNTVVNIRYSKMMKIAPVRGKKNGK